MESSEHLEKVIQEAGLHWPLAWSIRTLLMFCHCFDFPIPWFYQKYFCLLFFSLQKENGSSEIGNVSTWLVRRSNKRLACAQGFVGVRRMRRRDKTQGNKVGHSEELPSLNSLFEFLLHGLFSSRSDYMEEKTKGQSSPLILNDKRTTWWGGCLF